MRSPRTSMKSNPRLRQLEENPRAATKAQRSQKKIFLSLKKKIF